MDDTRLFAHSLPGRNLGEWERLFVHADAVRRLAGDFALPFGWAMAAEALGLLHDAGKASAEFQAYIRGNRTRGGDHSTWGARMALALYGEGRGRILAHCIAGHHAGLSDAEDLRHRLNPSEHQIPDASRWIEDIHVPDAENIKPTLQTKAPDPQRRQAFAQAFLIRMLFSCLDDADFLATEDFISGGSIERGVDVDLADLQVRLLAHMDAVRAKAAPTRLNELRVEILDHAVRKAAEAPGFFTLTVPTGGGKTLTSLAFALEHARLQDEHRKAKRRIIYVIPFTGARIETLLKIFFGGATMSLPRGSADRNFAGRALRRAHGGRSLAGARIETPAQDAVRMNDLVAPSRERGSKRRVGRCRRDPAVAPSCG